MRWLLYAVSKSWEMQLNSKANSSFPLFMWLLGSSLLDISEIQMFLLPHNYVFIASWHYFSCAAWALSSHNDQTARGQTNQPSHIHQPTGPPWSSTNPARGGTKQPDYHLNRGLPLLNMDGSAGTVGFEVIEKNPTLLHPTRRHCPFIKCLCSWIWLCKWGFQTLGPIK